MMNTRDVILDAFHFYQKSEFVDTQAAGMLVLAEALVDVSLAMERLGLNDADTRKGAIELLAEEVKGIGNAVRDLQPADVRP